MKLVLRVRLHGQPTTDHPLDEQYTLTEVQQQIDTAIERKIELTLMPDVGKEPITVDTTECEIISVTLGDYIVPPKGRK